MSNHPTVILSNISTPQQAIAQIEEFLSLCYSNIITSEEAVKCIHDVISYINFKIESENEIYVKEYATITNRTENCNG